MLSRSAPAAWALAARAQTTGLAACTRLLQQTWRNFSVDADTHDDFKPKFKAEPVGDITESIKKDISENTVFVYMKGTPDAPNCGFSNMACRVLDAYGVKYGSANVLADPNLREGIKNFTNWPTIPQVFVKGEFIGGADILYNMHETGELEKVLDPIIKEQQAAGK